MMQKLSASVLIAADFLFDTLKYRKDDVAHSTVRHLTRIVQAAARHLTRLLQAAAALAAAHQTSAITDHGTHRRAAAIYGVVTATIMSTKTARY